MPRLLQGGLLLNLSSNTMPLLWTQGGQRGPSEGTLGLPTSWDVSGQTNFRKCIAYSGTDWVAIASYMATKTQTMVENQYLRLVNCGDEDLGRAPMEGVERRRKGVDLGVAPELMARPKGRECMKPTIVHDIPRRHSIASRLEAVELIATWRNNILSSHLVLLLRIRDALLATG
ncbi:myb-like DNA-binding domain-containing protein [Paraphaeosphaeria sporulosa]